MMQYDYDPRDSADHYDSEGYDDEFDEPEINYCPRCGEELIYDYINEKYVCPTQWCLWEEKI